MYSNGDDITPGRVRHVDILTTPLHGRSYKVISPGVFIDNNFADYSGAESLMTHYKGALPIYLTSYRDEIIHGRSWEMSLAMALHGHTGVYTGVISDSTPDAIHFGSILGLDSKRDVFKNVQTNSEVPFIRRN